MQAIIAIRTIAAIEAKIHISSPPFLLYRSILHYCLISAALFLHSIYHILHFFAILCKKMIALPFLFMASANAKEPKARFTGRSPASFFMRVSALHFQTKEHCSRSALLFEIC